jgi:predicted O-linked N-acetylglucosamine transferase (SPINDLY family)
MGVLVRKNGRVDESLAALKKAVRYAPNDFEAHNNLANVLIAMDRLPEAEVQLRESIRIKSDWPESHYNLALALKRMGRTEESIKSYYEALRHRPHYAEALGNLSGIYLELADFVKAEQLARAAIATNQELVEAYNNLGSALNDQARLSEADFYYREAIKRRPGYAAALANLAINLYEQGRYAEAQSLAQQTLENDPGHLGALNILAQVYKVSGDTKNAERCYREALVAHPDHLETYSNLLFGINYAGSVEPENAVELARQYGAVVSSKATHTFKSWNVDLQSQVLRIGFVSADFNNHPVAFFIESLLREIDSTKLQVIAYPTRNRFDAITENIRPYFSDWVPLYGLSDEESAKVIHSNGIHILFDLSGHTGHTRLPLFAYKPSPLQVTWLGYFATTGLSEMDFILGDPYVIHENEKEHFVERPWCLPESYLCFTPPSFEVGIEPLPALKSGVITFGCFNNLAKIGDDVISLWAEILNSLTGARLFLKNKQLGDAVVAKQFSERLLKMGVHQDKLILEGESPRQEHLAAYNKVDIAFAPFPYPGGTTSVEALWMGVPVLTKIGDRFLSHVGETIVSNAGLSDWIAADGDEYVAKAIAFASDINRLALLRQGLREQVLKSPLFNAPRFARHFERAMWDMWQAERPC